MINLAPAQAQCIHGVPGSSSVSAKNLVPEKRCADNDLGGLVPSLLSCAQIKLLLAPFLAIFGSSVLIMLSRFVRGLKCYFLDICASIYLQKGPIFILKFCVFWIVFNFRIYVIGSCIIRLYGHQNARNFVILTREITEEYRRNIIIYRSNYTD